MNYKNIREVNLLDVIGLTDADVEEKNALTTIVAELLMHKLFEQIEKLPGFESMDLGQYDFSDQAQFTKFQTDLIQKYPEIKDLLPQLIDEVKVVIILNQIDDFEKYIKTTNFDKFPLKGQYLDEVQSLINSIRTSINQNSPEIGDYLDLYKEMKHTLEYN